MSPWQPSKPEFSTEAMPGVRVLPQASVTTGRAMLSGLARSIQDTIPVVSTSLTVNEDGLLIMMFCEMAEELPHSSVTK